MARKKESMAAVFKALLVVVAAAAVVLMIVFLPVKSELLTLLEWVQRLGKPAAAAVMASLCMFGIMLMLPVFIIFAPASGFILGVPLGMAAVLTGVLAGSSAAFLISRTVARDRVAARMAGNRKFVLMDKIIREKGFTYTVLLRFSPGFPASLISYGLGLTGISFRHFVLASFTAFIPIALLSTYIGFAARSLADIAEGRSGAEAGGGAMLWVGLAALLTIVILIARAARNALRP